MGKETVRPEAVALAVASRQHGAISRGQALAAGMSDAQIAQRVRTGVWATLHRGVYVVRGVPDSYEQRIMAAVLAGGPKAVASHRAAGVLMALDGVRGNVLEVTVPRTTRRRPAGTIVHVANLGPTDIGEARGVPSTDPVRTIIDLSSILPRRTLGLAIDDALRRRLLTLAHLRARTEALGGRGRSGTAVLREELDKRTDENDVTDSGGERLLLEAIRDAGLPEPVLHYLYRDGPFTAEIDMAWPRYRVGLELESRRYHFGYAKRLTDLARRNEIAIRGWLVLYVPDDDVQQPRHLIERVRIALRNSGMPEESLGA